MKQIFSGYPSDDDNDDEKVENEDHEPVNGNGETTDQQPRSVKEGESVDSDMMEVDDDDEKAKAMAGVVTLEKEMEKIKTDLEKTTNKKKKKKTTTKKKFSSDRMRAIKASDLKQRFKQLEKKAGKPRKVLYGGLFNTRDAQKLLKRLMENHVMPIVKAESELMRESFTNFKEKETSKLPWFTAEARQYFRVLMENRMAHMVERIIGHADNSGDEIIDVPHFNAARYELNYRAPTVFI